MKNEKKYILDEKVIQKKIERLALEVVENNLSEKKIFVVGIEKNGVVLAKNIVAYIKKYSKIFTELFSIDLDKQKPGKILLNKQQNFDDAVILLVDDVTNSGKTLLYALKPFQEFHPKKIETLVLVERTHTLFPVSANYKGISLSTTLQEHIYVEVKGDKVSGAYLL